MSGLQNLSLEQAAVLIASRVRVKQAVESTIKPEYSQTLQQPVTQPDPPRNATSPAGGEPGIMDRVRAALSNIDFGSLANKGMDAAKGFSPSSNPLHAALLGGGLGMGVGALGSLTSSDKEKRKRWLRNALFGGAMGGIGGAGLHAAVNYGSQVKNDIDAAAAAAADKKGPAMLSDKIRRWTNAMGDVTSLVPGGSGAAEAAFNKAKVQHPALLTLGGAGAGAAIDAGMSRHAVNKAKTEVLNNALYDKKFTAKINDTINPDLGRKNIPAITPEQLSAQRTSSLPAENPLKSIQQSINRSAANMRQRTTDFLTKTYPVNRPPVVPPPSPATGYHAPGKPTAVAPKLQPLQKPQRAALQAASVVHGGKDVSSKIPKQRLGALGALAGTILGGGLSMAGTPNMSPNDRARMNATMPTLQ